MLSLGIDIGGTKILGAAVSQSGEVMAEHRVPSPAQEPDQMVDTVSKLILDLIAENGEPEEIGVAAYSSLRTKSKLAKRTLARAH